MVTTVFLSVSMVGGMPGATQAEFISPGFVPAEHVPFPHAKTELQTQLPDVNLSPTVSAGCRQPAGGHSRLLEPRKLL